MRPPPDVWVPWISMAADFVKKVCLEDKTNVNVLCHDALFYFCNQGV